MIIYVKYLMVRGYNQYKTVHFEKKSIAVISVSPMSSLILLYTYYFVNLIFPGKKNILYRLFVVVK